MRLGLTVDSLNAQLTGIGRYTWELCAGLRRHERVLNLTYFRNDEWVRHPEKLLMTPHFRWRYPRVLRRRITANGFKQRLIHGTNYFLPAQTEIGVLTVHDMSIYRYPDMHPPERLAAFEKGFLASLSRAAHVVTDSRKVREELIIQTGIDPAKVTAIHLGVSDRFSPISEVQEEPNLRRLLGAHAANYMLCVATFEPRKRIEQAILAHAKLGQGRPIPPLVLVGAKGWLNEGLHALIERQTARGQLIMLGQVPEAVLPLLYAGARLFLYPSIYEGFGLPPIEAMASGVPVVVSNRSCLPEVTQGAAMMINPDDVDEFAEAIHRGLHDDKWRREAIDHGLRVAAGYTWGRCIENTVDVYRKVWAEKA